VLDFGLAKVAAAAPGLADDSPTGTLSGTDPGIVLGTAAYMSPEQALGKTVDKRTDIWAFGVVLFETLTGRRLFKGETTTELLAAVLKETPDFARVPVKTRLLLQHCLEKDPKRRLRDIADAMPLLELETVAERASHSRPWLAWTACAVFLLSAVGLAFVHFRETAPIGQSARLQVPAPEGLVFNAGTQATVSPDGRWLAFAATVEGVTRMYVRALDSLDVRVVQGSEFIGVSPPPAWSFDSRSIIFSSGGKLKKAEISGATQPQPICDLATTVQGAAMNSEGVIVFAGLRTALRSVAASARTSKPLTILASGETGHRWPQFLDDDRHFLYHRASSSVEKTGVYIGSLDAKPEDQSNQPLLVTDRQAYYVPAAGRGAGWLVFLRESTLVAQSFDPRTFKLSGDPLPIASPVGSWIPANSGLFSVSANGVLVYRAGGFGLPQLTWLNSEGKSLGVIADPSMYIYNNLALSPDGKRVAVQQTSYQEIAVLDVLRGTSTKLTFDGRQNNFPVWSPDGMRIAFASDRLGHMDLYEHNADGSGESRLLYQSEEDKIPTSWSPNGRFLLFESRSPKTLDDLWVLALDERKAVPFVRTDLSERQAMFSPDGRMVAYVSEQSVPEVFLQPFDPKALEDGAANVKGKSVVSKGGGSYPRWRGDGKQLFYLNFAAAQFDTQLMVVDMNPGDPPELGIPRRMWPPRTDPSANPNAGSYGVTSDGKQFLFLALPTASSTPPPFTVLLNWRESLKK